MIQERNYTIGNSRLKRAFQYGLKQVSDHKAGMLELVGEEEHFLILPVFDADEPSYQWGRFHFDVVADTGCQIIFHAFAKDIKDEAEKKELIRLNRLLYDAGTDIGEKRDIFVRTDGITTVNQSDILLLQLRGQYLWIALEIRGVNTGYINNMRLTNPADNFMQTFPEVYQDEGGFFHRYMTIFSTMYSNVQMEIDHFYELLDARTAPSEMLPVLAGWLGIKIEKNFFEDRILRELIENGYELNRKKGTRWAIEQLAKIILEDDAIQITERNLIEQENVSADEIDSYNNLYGSSKWDVTLVTNHAPDEELQEKFLYLAAQFKPIRCNVRLKFSESFVTMDSYSYMDKNASLSEVSQARLESGDVMDGSVIM